MPINCNPPRRSRSSGDLSQTNNLNRSKRCKNLNNIPDSTGDSGLDFFKAVKNTTKNTEFGQREEAKTTVTKEKISEKAWAFHSDFSTFKPTGASSSSTADPNIKNKFEFRKPRPIQFTQASSAQVSEPVQQEERPETSSAQKKNKLSRLWQGIKEVFSFLFRSCFPRTKTKSNDAAAISKTEIAGDKTVSKQTLEELSNKIDELVEKYGFDGLFRESGCSLELNKLTQQVNSGQKVDIDKIDNRDTAIGFFKRIMEGVTPLKYEEVQTILSNKTTHKEIGEEISKIITSKYPEEFLMILKTLGKFFEKASNNENSQFNVTSFTTCIPNLIKCESENLNLFAKQSKERPKMIEKILHKDTLEAIFTNITITSL
ncbi:RhoGAP domain-containing protein [Candidatus Williamhamiltonella defendens]|uniref:RhoGAP domain-containing protein n=1 Tax=Candidatus Williamhamiltonella defendens TaxID=138072 RepID=UPI000307DBA7|nr:RhoGAP domain-containing protein [Candidatus Hamiltonella defensa]